MAIVKMKKLWLLGLMSERDALMKDIQKLGCVEIADAGDELESIGQAEAFKRCVSSLTTLRTKQAQLNSARSVLDLFAPQKSKLFSPAPTFTADRIMDDRVLEKSEKTADVLNSAAADIATAKSEIARLEGEIAALEPWQELDMALETKQTDKTDIALGTLPSAAEFGIAEAAVANEAELAELTFISSDSAAKYVVLISHKTATENAVNVLRPYGFSKVSFTGKTGTAKENIAKLKSDISEMEKRIEADTEAIKKLSGERQELALAAAHLELDIQRGEAQEKLFSADGVFALRGWVPSEKECDLEALMKKYTAAWETEEPDTEDVPDVPVKLKNNWFSRPLNMVTNMYVLPAYDGLDPNPLMAPFFILIFGIMMADMGYGILMLIGGLLMIKKMQVKGGALDLAWLLVFCGVSTFIMGALTGGFFGDFIPQIAKIINPESTFTLPYLFTPLTDTLMILVGSLVLGVIQIFTGMIISVVKKFKDGQVVDAVFNEFTWWFILFGIGFKVLGIGDVSGIPVLLCVGGVMLVVSSAIENKGFGIVTGLIGKIYNGVTGYFSDILSYARIMALMLAGAVIAQVFNTLGAVTGNVVGFVVISMIGNLLNFALNLLGCYVHDLRLQCLEFFNRFYKEGGKPFRPMAITNKYVDTAE